MGYIIKCKVKRVNAEPTIENIINTEEELEKIVKGSYSIKMLPNDNTVTIIHNLKNNRELGRNFEETLYTPELNGNVLFVGTDRNTGEFESLSGEQWANVDEFIRDYKIEEDEEEDEEFDLDNFDITEDYDNTLKAMAKYNKKRDKGQGYFVKYDAGNVEYNNAMFNNSVNATADGGVGAVMSGELGEDLETDNIEEIGIRPAEKHKRGYMPKDALQLARDIANQLVKDRAEMDVSIYVGGRRYKIDKEGNLLYDIDANPKDYFKYARTPNILSMSFEGSLYQIINYENIDYLQPLFQKYGLYYELGNDWNLSAYPIIEKDWEEFDMIYYREHNIEITEKLTNKKICSECKKELKSGFVIDDGDEYYCSEECLHKHYTPEEYEKMVKNSKTEFTSDDYDYSVGQAYWTEFEENKITEEYDDGDEDLERLKENIVTENTRPIKAIILHKFGDKEWFAFYSENSRDLINNTEKIEELLKEETPDERFREIFNELAEQEIYSAQTSDSSLYHVNNNGKEEELYNSIPEEGYFIVVTPWEELLRVNEIVEFIQKEKNK